MTLTRALKILRRRHEHLLRQVSERMHLPPDRLCARDHHARAEVRALEIVLSMLTTAPAERPEPAP